MHPFVESTALVFVAELGDKSQLAALAFASRFSARLTLAAIAAATLVVHFMSVVLGEGIAAALPTAAIQLLSGLAFVIFGLWTLRGDRYDDGGARWYRLGPFGAVAVTFFLAELGDKTMLATVTLAGQLVSFVAVWLGSTVGMVAADAIAIAVGRFVGARLPARAVKLVAAAVFFAYGAWTVLGALREIV